MAPSPARSQHVVSTHILSTVPYTILSPDSTRVALSITRLYRCHSVVRLVPSSRRLPAFLASAQCSRMPRVHVRRLACSGGCCHGARPTAGGICLHHTPCRPPTVYQLFSFSLCLHPSHCHPYAGTGTSSVTLTGPWHVVSQSLSRVVQRSPNPAANSRCARTRAAANGPFRHRRLLCRHRLTSRPHTGFRRGQPPSAGRCS